MNHTFQRLRAVRKRTFAFNTFIMTSANAITRALGFAYRIFLSRLIGAEGMGLFGLIMPIYSICATIVATGLPTASLKLLSEKRALNNRRDTANIMHSSLFIVAALSIALALLVLAFSDKLSVLIGDSRTKLPIMLLCATVLITGFENIYKSYFYALEKMHIPAGAEVLEQIVRTLFVIGIFIYFRPNNIIISISVMVIGMFVGEAVSGVFLKTAYKKHGVRSEGNKGIAGAAKSVISVAVPITTTKIVTTLIQSATTIIIPMQLLKFGMNSSRALSLFGIINGMIMPLLFLPFTLTNALCVNLVPSISSGMVLGKTDVVRHKLSKTMYVTALFVFPCVALISSVAVPLGNVLYAERLVGVYLPIMAAGSVLQTYQHIFTSVLNASGGERGAALIFAVGSCLQLFLTYVLTPAVGIYGYIAGYLVSSAFICVADYIMIYKILYLTPKVFSWFIKPLTACLLAYFVSKIAYTYFFTANGEPIAFVLSIAAFAAVYLCAVLVQSVFKTKL